MWVRDKDKPMVAKFMQLLSVVAVGLAAVGAAGTDIFLASTQWMLVGLVMSMWGIYLLLEAEFRS